MLARFDTLLVRMLALLGMAIASAFVIGFLSVRMQQSMRSPTSRMPLDIAVSALDQLHTRGWPRALSRSELRALSLSDYSRTAEPQSTDARSPFSSIVRGELGLSSDAEIRVDLDTDRPLLPGIPHGDGIAQWSDAEGVPGSRPGGPPRRMSIRISLKLAPGDWVNVSTVPITPFDRAGPWGPLLALVLMVAIVIWAARNATSPLRQMARAADVLAAGYVHHPLQEIGPSDVRDALQAFNNMGRRLESIVSGQRQLLAAIGHDLRTPITSLKLKTEMLSQPEERERMRRALGELERITEAALIAASAGQSAEEFQPLDIFSLLDSISDDLVALGHDVQLEETSLRPVVSGREGELTRALRNLVENAVRYGDRARIRLLVIRDAVLVEIEDEGPGIPEGYFEHVFQPLVRLEQSRSRETGGHGLGLYIAKSVVEAHGGTIELVNLHRKGLLVTVTLPLHGS